MTQGTLDPLDALFLRPPLKNKTHHNFVIGVTRHASVVSE
jgi:hypothetical protein